MRLGVDFDNTIVDYTGVFYDVALKLGWISSNIETTKDAVKAHFIGIDQEAKWTELQGIVYGSEIYRAKPYLGVLDTLKSLKKEGHQLFLVSHKTRYPIIGDKVDFHQAAEKWLREHTFVGSTDSPFNSVDLYFNETKESKLEAVATLKCDIFFDDLPSILNHPLFPDSCKKVLFNPNSIPTDLPQFKTWLEVSKVL